MTIVDGGSLPVAWLSQRFGSDILGTYLDDVSETKLTTVLALGKNLDFKFCF